MELIWIQVCASFCRILLGLVWAEQWIIATWVERSSVKHCFRIRLFPHPSGPISKNGCLYLLSNHGMIPSTPLSTWVVLIMGNCDGLFNISTLESPGSSLTYGRMQSARGSYVILKAVSESGADSPVIFSTYLEKSLSVLCCRLPPRPLIRPTAKWPFSLIPCKCDKPFSTLPTRLVGTRKSF